MTDEPESPYPGGERHRVRKPPDDWPEDEPIPTSEYRPDLDVVDEVVNRVAAAEGDLTIALVGRIGATPWLRPTPYRCHAKERQERGPMIRMWSCISQYPKAMPARTMLFGRRVFIWPDEGDYNVRMFTREWTWAQVRKALLVEVVPASESPWLTDWYNWHWEERDDG